MSEEPDKTRINAALLDSITLTSTLNEGMGSSKLQQKTEVDHIFCSFAYRRSAGEEGHYVHGTKLKTSNSAGIDNSRYWGTTRVIFDELLHGSLYSKKFCVRIHHPLCIFIFMFGQLFKSTPSISAACQKLPCN